jgi:hypothetical protein
MKKIALGLAVLTIGTTILSSALPVYASELDTPVQEMVLPENVVIENTEDGIVVTKYEEGYSAEDFADYSTEYIDGVAYAAISRWAKTQYTNIAISTGVAANAINTGLYSGLGAVIGTFAGIPMWAIQGLLNGVSWTKRGSKPGAAVAKLWDKNKNGWIGFYYQKGYDAAGRVVATRYSTL